KAMPPSSEVLCEPSLPASSDANKVSAAETLQMHSPCAETYCRRLTYNLLKQLRYNIYEAMKSHDCDLIEQACSGLENAIASRLDRFDEGLVKLGRATARAPCFAAQLSLACDDNNHEAMKHASELLMSAEGSLAPFNLTHTQANCLLRGLVEQHADPKLVLWVCIRVRSAWNVIWRDLWRLVNVCRLWANAISSYELSEIQEAIVACHSVKLSYTHLEDWRSHVNLEFADILMPLPGSRKAGNDAKLTDSPPLHIIFVLDQSRSMSKADAGPKGTTRMTAVLSMCREFVDMQMKDAPSAANDHYSLLTFNSEHTCLFRRLDPASAQLHLQVLQVVPAGQTRFLAGLRAAESVFHSSDRTRILFLSDGRPGDEVAMLTAFQQSVFGKMEANRPDVQWHCVGFGQLDTFVPLQQLAALGHGTFQHACLSLEGLRGAFSSISSTVTETRLPATCLEAPTPHQLRQVTFEPFDSFKRKTSNVLRCRRIRYVFSGSQVQTEAEPEHVTVQ
ncbi:unnamed protein product, partial [Polarella glacialis]